MPRCFLLARHGESEWNRQARYQGRLDESELSELGRKQAEALAVRLQGRKLVAIYTSPLLRARQTAEVVARAAQHSALSTQHFLTDVDHGEWSGLPHAEVEARWPELHARWLSRPDEVRFPGGESLLEVRGRALGFLAWARQEHADGDILVISHGEVLQLLLAHFLDMRPGQIWTIPRDNCALSIVEDYDVPLVMAINDRCHLEGLRSSAWRNR